jgi:hypothetical protein
LYFSVRLCIFFHLSLFSSTSLDSFLLSPPTIRRLTNSRSLVFFPYHSKRPVKFLNSVQPCQQVNRIGLLRSLSIFYFKKTYFCWKSMNCVFCFYCASLFTSINGKKKKKLSIKARLMFLLF